MSGLSRRDVLPMLFSIVAVLSAGVADSHAAEGAPLHVGWATTDITPPKPAALAGQGHLRVSKGVDDPITATVLALETRSADGKVVEQAVMVSCDLVLIRRSMQEKLKKLVAARLDDFDADKLMLNATHTHTAPQIQQNSFNGRYDVSKVEGAMNATQYGDFLTGRLADAVVKAWQQRKPGGMSWALGQAVVGLCRRTVYFDGHARMYGNTNQEDFQCMEGYEDHGLPLLFFFDQKGELTGIVINVACPSQETETLSTVSADFWHEVRQEIWKRYSKKVAVFAQCSAAGDISPHFLLRKSAERIMMKRMGVTRRQEIALRIADGVDRVFPSAKEAVATSLVFKHTVVRADLPVKTPPSPPFYACDSVTPAEFHVLRLGDVAVATNPFELYLDYGLRIQARSKAVLTFVVQLSCHHSGYLPTAKAVRGGSYSADKFIVGPEGGQVLVNRTVEAIDQLWTSK